MANGRFISNTLGASHKFSAVASDTHRVMYMLLITHTDVEGRLDADPRVLNGRAFTLMGWTTDQVQDGLVALADAELLHLYSVDGRQYAEIVDFHKHNKVRKDREKASDIPARDSRGAAVVQHARGSPPGGLPETAGSSPQQVEVQVQVQDQVQDKHSSPEIETRSRPALAATPPRATHDPGLFMEAWNQHRGRLPAVTSLNAKRKAAIRALVKEHGPDTALDLLRDATRAVAADDFWLERQYGLDNLLTGKVLARAEQWRNGGVQLGEGNIRLAANVERWAKALPDGVN